MCRPGKITLHILDNMVHDIVNGYKVNAGNKIKKVMKVKVESQWKSKYESESESSKWK